MSYLEPPPFPAPVIVMKDVGGLVTDYQARTEQYRREGREVRLHECRSACTLALSLPNVCVYPTSILKFHKAYNWDTKVRDEGVLAVLFASYPAAVQARLGGLTVDYRVLTGAELISLGFRNCNEGATLVARNTVAPKTTGAPAQAGGTTFASTLQSVVSNLPTLFGQQKVDPEVGMPASRVTLNPPPLSQGLKGSESAPLPPRRPIELARSDVAAEAPVVQSLTKTDAIHASSMPENKPEERSVPLPPAKPAALSRMIEARWPAQPPLISGSQIILATQSFRLAWLD